MGDEWKLGTLATLATLASGKRPPIVTKDPAPGSDVPVIGGGGPSGFTVAALYDEPILVTGRVGTLGKLHVSRGPSWPSDNAIVVLPRVGVDWRFLQYGLQAVIHEAIGMNRGAANPLVTQGDLGRLRIPVPARREQEAIGAVLGALDDKIELNRRMNETLEALSQAVFDAWVLNAYSGPDDAADLDKWEQTPLDRIANFLNGAACQKYPVGVDGASLPVVKIRELNQGITPQSDRVTTAIPKKWHVRDGDVLFSWSGTLLAKLWTGGDAALNQHLFKVTSADYPKWFYFRWVLHHLKAFRGVAADKATTMGHIKRHHLTDAVCLVPPPSTFERLDDLMAPLLERQLACDMESRILGELRDALLPKLISGDLRMSDAERLVSEVI